MIEGVVEGEIGGVLHTEEYVIVWRVRRREDGVCVG